jgi:hypothetical protein
LNTRKERRARTLLEAGDVVLGNLGLHPLEELALGVLVARAAAVDLVPQNEGPDKAEGEPKVAIGDVHTA